MCADGANSESGSLERKNECLDKRRIAMQRAWSRYGLFQRSTASEISATEQFKLDYVANRDTLARKGSGRAIVRVSSYDVSFACFD
jgi:hypothetical protein